MKKGGILLLLAGSLFLSACSTPWPKGFQPIGTTGWSVIEIRNEVSPERSWKSVVAVLVRDFDLEFMSQEDGYIRTAWSHTWNGLYLPQYRVRVTVFFPEDRQTVRIKPEAQAMNEDGIWISGQDSRLPPALKAELIGTLGRTLR